MPPDDEATTRHGSPMSTFRLGIDIGGTFTDGALVDETNGEDAERQGSVDTR